MSKYYVISVLCILNLFSSLSFADATPQTITSECTTKETGADGVRHNCHANPTVLTAPNGYVFAEKSAKGGYSSKAGSENECKLSFSEYVEILPGSEIQQPRKVSLKAYALSPKGRLKGRGWSKCSYEIKLSKYQS